MRRIVRFTSLARAHTILLLRAFVWIALVHFALRFMPFRLVWRWSRRRSPLVQTDDFSPVDRTLWAVEVAGTFLLPERPCLTKAIVGQMFLNRLGYETTLRIGVKRDDNLQLKAHAWLEHGQQVVIGNLRNLSTFEPFPPLTLPD